MVKPAAALLSVLEKHSIKCALLFVLIATVRIASVYPVYNHTIDEPAHIACGMEWLSKGQYKLEPQHPPLSRIFNAIGPYLDGARSTDRHAPLLLAGVRRAVLAHVA
jgi:hypothetical protein